MAIDRHYFGISRGAFDGRGPPSRRTKPEHPLSFVRKGSQAQLYPTISNLINERCAAMLHLARLSRRKPKGLDAAQIGKA